MVKTKANFVTETEVQVADLEKKSWAGIRTALRIFRELGYQETRMLDKDDKFLGTLHTKARKSRVSKKGEIPIRIPISVEVRLYVHDPKIVIEFEVSEDLFQRSKQDEWFERANYGFERHAWYVFQNLLKKYKFINIMSAGRGITLQTRVIPVTETEELVKSIGFCEAFFSSIQWARGNSITFEVKFPTAILKGEHAARRVVQSKKKAKEQQQREDNWDIRRLV